MLNERKSEIIREIWQAYDVEGVTFYNDNEATTPDKIDTQRKEVIPEIQTWLDEFIAGDVPLDEFKTAVDGINKRHPLWGFKGFTGQMFFNMLTKTCQQYGYTDELNALLKKSLVAPEKLDDAVEIIQVFRDFTEKVGRHYEDRRAAPRVGSIPFFLSYFWQIQKPEKYPVYYTSMVNVLSDLDIWTPKKEVAADYAAFYRLNYEILALCSELSDREITLWDIEHAFWYYSQKIEEEKSEKEEQLVECGNQAPKRASKLERLPDSYLPSIVAVLPKLAENDEHIATLCEKAGQNIVKVFEDRLAILFRMLGYEVDPLGQGHGRVPDGVAISPEYRYAIIFDAKVRKDGYTMGTDERAIREYIIRQGERLRRDGYRNIYFMIISSSFSGDHDSEIRSLKINTNVREIQLVEVSALLVLLEGKFRNPEITLGPNGVQNLLAASGLLTAADVRAFLG